MNYLSVKEVSEKWGISQALVRRYCGQNRIPKAKYQNGSWLIPEKAEKPEKLGPTPNMPELSPLAVKLVRQKKKKNFHGLYDYVQINFTYSSSRMASNRLTRDQVESIFKKGKVRESFEPLKVSDLVEAMNHCACIDYVLDHIQEPLTQKLVQHLHYLLMFGTVDHRKNRVTPGVYRTEKAAGRNRQLLDPVRINSSLGALLKEYESQTDIGRTQILDFHVRFEKIFPFEDGNGRIGRLIMFKECLRHNVMPFILDDKRRRQYLAGIQEWQTNRMMLIQVVASAQDRFEAQIELQKLDEHRPCEYMDEDGGEEDDYEDE